ncbi:unnamed protein product [Caenorhabditis bovis]|uniref:C-type lectin domain-containing protein n=1 Tax=Caenorhabditis bovis TaxID=2654633 RepID=A0A8S1F7K1_9PELO|nr:unnamed protein product [Caenorhabditis bovis]
MNEDWFVEMRRLLAASQNNTCRTLVVKEGTPESKIRRLESQHPDICWQYRSASALVLYQLEQAKKYEQMPNDFLPTFHARVLYLHSPFDLAIQPKYLDNARKNLSKSMNDYFMNEEPTVFERNQLIEGVACVVRLDEKWQRARIDRVVSRDFVSISLVDFGRVKVINPSNIYHLQKQLGKIPPLALVCAIKGVQYHSIDIDVIHNFRKTVSDLKYQVQCQITNSSQPYLINLFHPTIHGFNLCEHMYGLCEPPPPPHVLESAEELSDEETSDDEQMPIQMYIKAFPRSEKASRFSDTFFYVVHVEHANLIYLENEWMRERRKQIESSIEEIFEDLYVIPKDWYVVGAACAILAPTPKRAVIQNISENSTEYFLIDYGIHVELDKSEMPRILPASAIFSEIPQITVTGLTTTKPVHYSAIKILRDILPVGKRVRFHLSKKSDWNIVRGDLTIDRIQDVEEMMNEILEEESINIYCKTVDIFRYFADIRYEAFSIAFRLSTASVFRSKNASLFMHLLILALLLLSSCHANPDDIVLKLSADKQGQTSGHHFSGEWLEAPWGSLYQFRAGDQSWLTAREHCLSLNADLAVLNSTDQLDWILSHYAPISSRFSQRFVQIGLYAEDGKVDGWKWVDGSSVSDQFHWSNTEPYDHSSETKERCGLLSVEKKRFHDVDCEATSKDHRAIRYICQRSTEKHKEQQKSNNYIWGKIEQLFGFFGIGTTPTKYPENTQNLSYDYETELRKNQSVKFTDSVEEDSSEEEEHVLNTLSKLPKIETPSEGSADNVESLKEISEGSGHAEKAEIENTAEDEAKLDNMIAKMEEMIKNVDEFTTISSIERTTISSRSFANEVDEETENEKEPVKRELDDNEVAASIEEDFNEEKTKDMPKADITPPKIEQDKEDCVEGSGDEGSGGSGEEDDDEIAENTTPKLVDETEFQTIELSKEKEEHIKEFLGVLRLFLNRAEHGDLKKLLSENNGKTLLDRMKNAIKEANEREFKMLEKMEEARTKGKGTEEIEESKTRLMTDTEQKEIYKKISTAVIQAAKTETHSHVDKEESGEKFKIATEKLKNPEGADEGGRIEVLKSARESHNDDYYGDYLDENNVVKVASKKKKAFQHDEGSVASSTEMPTTSEKATTEAKEVEQTTATTIEDEATTTTAEEATAEAETTTTTAPTTTTTEKATTPAPPTTHTAPPTSKAATTTKATPTKHVQASTKEVPKTTAKPVEKKQPKPQEATKKVVKEDNEVAVKKIDAKTIEELSKIEAQEKVTLLPPLPTFTFPTIAPAKPSKKTTPFKIPTGKSATTPKPFTFPTIKPITFPTVKPVTFPTVKPVTFPTVKPVTFPTVKPFTFPTLPPTTTPKPLPTLDELLGNWNNTLKKLLTPPKA